MDDDSMAGPSLRRAIAVSRVVRGRPVTRRPVRRWRAAVAVGLVAMVLGACSSGADEGAGGTGPADAPGGSPTTAASRPEGPSADISQELTGGTGVFIGSAQGTSIGDGYVEQEYVAAGTATAYGAAGDLAPDGRWTLQPGAAADYRTRVIVRRPEKAEDFSGNVLVEWLNVSGGIDADPEYATLREEIARRGDAWVGVSAQLIGVEGGPVAVKVDVPGAEVAGQGLKKIDPERYGSLQHPGDAYAFDIYTQVARALRSGTPAIGDLEPTHVLAVGESQSAFALVTYINGVQPLTNEFDGFFVHSRGASGLAIAPAGQYADIASSIGGVKTILRTDTTVPVFDVQTENDLTSVLGSAAVRQPDTDTFRLWEVPGTAHADRHLTGSATADLVDCGVPINDGPLHVVAKAAFRHFVSWVEGGDLPPIAPRIELTEGATPAVVRDSDGIAAGGVRTPPVDTPVRVLSGVQGPNDSIICLLFGSTKPLSIDRLAQLYSSRDDYQAKYDAGVDTAIEAGYVLAKDRVALEGYAHPELVPG